MRAMILAAGSGERMRPLTNKIPKPMLEVNNKPLIQYHVENLVQAGIVDIVINHAVYGDQIETYLGDGKAFGAQIVYSAEGDQPMETAGGIVKALSLLGEAPFLTVNADIWTAFPFQQLVNLSGEITSHLAHIILVDNPAHNPEGDFSLSENRVLNEGDPMLTFSGISVFTPEFFKGCASGSKPLAPMIRQAASRGQVSGSHYQGQWRDIGSPERLQELRQIYSY
ncbi:MAG: MurNAc alpha-1-phosphate uridylyltransferase [Gammaproteobacteria bacterium]